MMLSVLLSVITNPPYWHPHASSNDPVLVTFAALAHSTPIFMTVSGSVTKPSSAKTAVIIELHAELELFRPLDGGVSERVRRCQHSGSSVPTAL